jgi:malate synthase
MEDMATGEIRLSILWEWVHKGAKLTDDDPESGIKSGDIFDETLFKKLLEEEYKKLLYAKNKDVHDDSKTTTLPISREIAHTYVLDPVKAPWFIDLLNISLNATDLAVAKKRIQFFMEQFKKNGTRVTENMDFQS